MSDAFPCSEYATNSALREQQSQQMIVVFINLRQQQTELLSALIEKLNKK